MMATLLLCANIAIVCDVTLKYSVRSFVYRHGGDAELSGEYVVLQQQVSRLQ